MKNEKKYFLFLFWLLPCVLYLLPNTSFAQLTVTSTVTDAPCSYDSAGSISVSVSGGAIPYTYLWSPGGEATSLVTGLLPGTYGLTVTDNAGADSTLSFLIGPAPLANDTLSGINLPFCTNNGSIVLNVSGGTGAYQYLWSNSSTEAAVGQLPAGYHSVEVTDGNNCKAIFSFSLAEKECFVSPEPYFTPNGDGHNDTWFIANSQYFEDARVIIFDRWGMKVFEHRGLYESWDGKSYLGVPVPDAVYYYFFYQDKDDKQKATKNGSVTLLR